MNVCVCVSKYVCAYSFGAVEYSWAARHPREARRSLKRAEEEDKKTNGGKKESLLSVFINFKYTVTKRGKLGANITIKLAQINHTIVFNQNMFHLHPVSFVLFYISKLLQSFCMLRWAQVCDSPAGLQSPLSLLLIPSGLDDPTETHIIQKHPSYNNTMAS